MICENNAILGEFSTCLPDTQFSSGTNCTKLNFLQESSICESKVKPTLKIEVKKQSFKKIPLTQTGMFRDTPQKILESHLPMKFENKIVACDEKSTTIRCNLKNMEDIKEWVKEFSELTHTHWNTRDSRPQGKKFVCRKNYVCHHSSFMKVPNCSRWTKCLNCKATLTVKIKVNKRSTRYRDPFVKMGLFAVIVVKNLHSHSLTATEALNSLKPIDEFTRNKFIEYFESGMGLAMSHHYHESILEMENRTEEEKSNTRINPSLRTITNWYRAWKKSYSSPKEEFSENKIKNSLAVYDIEKSMEFINEDSLRHGDIHSLDSDNNITMENGLPSYNLEKSIDSITENFSRHRDLQNLDSDNNITMDSSLLSVYDVEKSIDSMNKDSSRHSDIQSQDSDNNIRMESSLLPVYDLEKNIDSINEDSSRHSDIESLDSENNITMESSLLPVYGLEKSIDSINEDSSRHSDIQSLDNDNNITQENRVNLSDKPQISFPVPFREESTLRQQLFQAESENETLQRTVCNLKCTVNNLTKENKNLKKSIRQLGLLLKTYESDNSSEFHA